MDRDNLEENPNQQNTSPIENSQTENTPAEDTSAENIPSDNQPVSPVEDLSPSTNPSQAPAIPATSEAGSAPEGDLAADPVEASALENTLSEDTSISNNSTKNTSIKNPSTEDSTANTQATAKPSSKWTSWFSKNKKLSVAIICALIVLMGGTSAALLLNKKSDNTEAPSNSAQEESPVNDTKINSVVIEDIKIFDNAQPVEPIKIFKDLSFAGLVCKEGEAPDLDCATSSAIKESDVVYGQIGTIKGDGKLIAVIFNNGMDTVRMLVASMGDDTVILAKIIPYGYFSVNENDQLSSTDNLEFLEDNVTIDTTTTIPEMEFPEEVTVKGQRLKSNGTETYFMINGLKDIHGSIFDKEIDPSAIELLEDKDNRLYHEATVSKTPTYEVRAFYGTYKNVFAHKYVQDGEIAGNKDEIEIKWTSGEQNKSRYYSAGGGCGSSTGYVIALNINKSQLNQIGSSPAGQPIFQLANTHPLVTELYEKDYAKGEFLIEGSSLKNMDIQQFSSQHSYFLVENGLGDYVVFLRDDVIVRGGCAKPVVYLYPTEPTKVNVSVGADVTISDPFYPKGGWKDVLAQPNGSLNYKGGAYSSLFWEGYGYGEYPSITAGTVVERSKAIATIEKQLIQQGMQGREITDFVEFWESRLPGNPYIRLTWLSQRQIDNLAPLNVHPKPDTVIRVFLDFEGLDQPIDIKPQHFTAPARNGFTVTEWGGLARNGLQAL